MIVVNVKFAARLAAKRTLEEAKKGAGKPKATPVATPAEAPAEVPAEPAKVETPPPAAPVEEPPKESRKRVVNAGIKKLAQQAATKPVKAEPETKPEPVKAAEPEPKLKITNLQKEFSNLGGKGSLQKTKSPTALGRLAAISGYDLEGISKQVSAGQASLKVKHAIPSTISSDVKLAKGLGVNPSRLAMLGYDKNTGSEVNKRISKALNLSTGYVAGAKTPAAVAATSTSEPSMSSAAHTSATAPGTTTGSSSARKASGPSFSVADINRLASAAAKRKAKADWLNSDFTKRLKSAGVEKAKYGVNLAPGASAPTEKAKGGIGGFLKQKWQEYGHNAALRGHEKASSNILKSKISPISATSNANAANSPISTNTKIKASLGSRIGKVAGAAGAAALAGSFVLGALGGDKNALELSRMNATAAQYHAFSDHPGSTYYGLSQGTNPVKDKDIKRVQRMVASGSGRSVGGMSIRVKD